MGSRLFRRRLATAAGSYGSVALGVVGTLIAARRLTPHPFGDFSLVLAAVGFFQTLLDLTVEEALIKYGFRYSTVGDWGRLRRLFGLAIGFKATGAAVAGVILFVLSFVADRIFGAHGLRTPFMLAALLPLAQAPESFFGATLVLRSRYDIRAGFLALTAGLRLVGLGIGAGYGVGWAVAGTLIAQTAASCALGTAGLAAMARFPRAPQTLLADHRREIAGFIIRSSLATGVVSLRGTLAPLLLGLVTSPLQVGYFRVGQSPQGGLAALTGPARLILITEQTRDWERGKFETVFGGLRRFSTITALMAVVAVPPLFVWMPQLVRLVYGDSYAGAGNPARFMLLAGTIQVVIAWTKSFPVSIGRPDLRVITHSVETVVLVPLVLVFGAAWGASGACLAVAIAAAVFAAQWIVLVTRLRRDALRGAVRPQPAPRELPT